MHILRNLLDDGANEKIKIFIVKFVNISIVFYIFIGHSRMSSRSDIAHHDFGQSWVCVDLKDLEKLEAAKNEEEAEAEAAKAAAGGSSAGAGPSEQHSQPEGTSVVGNLLETFHNFFKHDA